MMKNGTFAQQRKCCSAVWVKLSIRFFTQPLLNGNWNTDICFNMKQQTHKESTTRLVQERVNDMYTTERWVCEQGKGKKRRRLPPSLRMKAQEGLEGKWMGVQWNPISAAWGEPWHRGSSSGALRQSLLGERTGGHVNCSKCRGRHEQRWKSEDDSQLLCWITLSRGAALSLAF